MLSPLGAPLSLNVLLFSKQLFGPWVIEKPKELCKLCCIICIFKMRGPSYWEWDIKMLIYPWLQLFRQHVLYQSISVLKPVTAPTQVYRLIDTFTLVYFYKRTLRNDWHFLFLRATLDPHQLWIHKLENTTRVECYIRWWGLYNYA